MKLLAALLALLLCALPASGMTESDARAIATSVGVPAEVEITVILDPTAGWDFNGVFMSPGIFCLAPWLCGELPYAQITVLAGPQTPEDVLTLTLLHEIAHYFFWQTGMSFATDADEEWAADLWAMNIGCDRFGLTLDAARTWGRIALLAGAYDDPAHGPTSARVLYVLENTQCLRRGEEA